MRLHPLDGLLFVGMRLGRCFSKRPRPLAQFDPERVKRIIVVSSTAIGDTLLSTPAIRALRRRYPRARITGHILYKYLALFADNPHLDEIVPYYGGYRRFCRTVAALRRRKPDVVAILHGNGPQAIPMAWLSGAPFIVRIPNRSEYRFLLSNQEQTAANECNPQEHGIQDRLRTAALLDALSDNKRMVLTVEESARQAVADYLQAKGMADAAKLIGLQVAASTVSRMWMKDRFAQLGRKILNRFPEAKIIVTGSPRERSYCCEVADMMDNPARVLVSAGELPLKQVPAMIEKLTLLVTGDTGIMHMAIALGTPTVSLFAVADPRKSAACYDRDKHIVIAKGKTCDPCPGKKCPYPKCMEQIEVQEVFAAVQRFFNGKGES